MDTCLALRPLRELFLTGLELGGPVPPSTKTLHLGKCRSLHAEQNTEGSESDANQRAFAIILQVAAIYIFLESFIGCHLPA